MPPKGDEDFVPKKKEGECVKVVVRVRPLSRKEIQDGHDEATKADEDSGAYRGVLTCFGGFPRCWDSYLTHDAGGRFFFDFEAVRTAFDGRCSAQAASRARTRKPTPTSRPSVLPSMLCLRLP